jgi:hypothetical protein
MKKLTEKLLEGKKTEPVEEAKSGFKLIKVKMNGTNNEYVGILAPNGSAHLVMESDNHLAQYSPREVKEEMTIISTKPFDAKKFF